MDIKYHKNIIVRALIKISLLDSLLFIIFSLSLFINMLFWLEEWQRTRQPLKKMSETFFVGNDGFQS
ncbi:conserved hypothetical protein [Yersinia pestis KIM D27]|nr:conserved hypothetical protein [Yersinia pestis KIM D27]